MKKIVSCGIVALFAASAFNAFGGKPTIMILPDDTWCTSHNYVKSYSDGSQKEDYAAAFKDEDLTMVIGEMDAMFTADGVDFPTVDYNASRSNRSGIDAMAETFESKTSGSGIASTAFDDLVSGLSQKPDIRIAVFWKEQPMGFQKIVNYKIEAIDAYSGKKIATVTGTSDPQSRNFPVANLIMLGIRDKQSEFLNKIQKHFDDVQTNGREISLDLKIVDNGSGLSFDDEFGEDDDELAILIRKWVAKNTVNHQFTQRQKSDNGLSFDQVRMAYLDEEGMPQDAQSFVDKLRKYLRKNFQIESKNVSQGLGTGVLMVGEK